MQAFAGAGVWVGFNHSSWCLLNSYHVTDIMLNAFPTLSHVIPQPYLAGIIQLILKITKLELRLNNWLSHIRGKRQSWVSKPGLSDAALALNHCCCFSHFPGLQGSAKHSETLRWALKSGWDSPGIGQGGEVWGLSAPGGAVGLDLTSAPRAAVLPFQPLF